MLIVVKLLITMIFENSATGYSYILSKHYKNFNELIKLIFTNFFNFSKFFHWKPYGNTSKLDPIAISIHYVMHHCQLPFCQSISCSCSRVNLCNDRLCTPKVTLIYQVNKIFFCVIKRFFSHPTKCNKYLLTFSWC